MKAEDIKLNLDYKDKITGLVGRVLVLVLTGKALQASFEVTGHTPELINLERLEPLTLN